MKPNKDGWKPLVIIQCYEDRQPTLPVRKTSTPSQPLNNGHVANSTPSTRLPPPPPPPMPVDDSSNDVTKYNGVVEKILINGTSNSLLGNSYVKNKAVANGKIAVNTNATTNTAANGMQNGKSIKMFDKPPINGALKRTPTPDYETTNIETLTSKLKLKTFHGEAAEVDSIESYKMKNPTSTNPKPPPNYFMRAPNGTATMKKSGRPVSITIGEYPSRTLRKEPSKLGFLNGDEKTNADLDKDEQEPIGSRLQSELVMTLSRSNLRKKTDLQPKLDNNGNIAVDSSEDSDPTPDMNFHKRYGNNILPTPPPIAIPKVPVVKTNSHPISKHIAMLAGKVSLANRAQDGQSSFEQTPTAKGDHQAIIIGK